MSFPYVIQGSCITIIIDNNVYTFDKTHLAYNKVLDAIKNNEWDVIKEIIDPKKIILNYGKGNVSIQGEQLFWKGEEFHNALASRLISMFQEGFPIEPMVRFMENLMKNPSKNSVDQLYSFLERCNLPITEDGHFLAYKRVSIDYKDVFSGIVDNRPASLLSEEESKQVRKFGEVLVSVEDGNTVVRMRRHTVDDVREHLCSYGLHFCSKDYLSHFGGDRILILKINPKDVVSVPSDYSFTKARCCKYIIIGELGVSPDDAFKSTVQNNPCEIVDLDDVDDYDYTWDDLI